MKFNRPYDKYYPEIKKYCEKNGLNFEKLKHSPKGYTPKVGLFIHYVDYENDKGLGLLDETPCKITLEIWIKEDDSLEIKQTEHTKKYLT